jgi:branched-chain amino acid transport system ATP-binding protein
MSLLEVDELDQFYGDLQALFGISLHVDEGEIVAIIGANGAGKSTLLRTVAGVMRSTSGSVRFDGRSILDLPAYARVPDGISMVPEGRRIFPSLNVQENLMVGAFGRRPGPWNLERVYELFPMLTRLAKRSAAVLSGGEQQTVAIGRALMANPRLLLMDEISLGLAPIVVKDLYAAVPAIAAAGTTLVIVEQDVGQALRIADRAYCFLEGRISLQGKAPEMGRDAIRAAYFGV